MAEEPRDAGPEQGPVPKTTQAQKVELDLDDAPFLEDEPEPAPPKQPEPEKKTGTAAAPLPVKTVQSLKDRFLGPLLARVRGNRKKLAVAGAGAAVLIAAGIGVNVFLFGEKTEPAPVAAPPERVEMKPAPLPKAEAPQFLMRFEPFWVEARDTEGAVRFLTARVTIPTNNPTLFAEMNGKRLILRDALFYYLRNQPIRPLNTPALADKFKEDLLAVLNEHLGSGKADEILIEEFLIQ